MPTLTIDMTQAQVDRVCAAVGKLLSLGRNATPTEARTWLINYIKDAVLKQEQHDALQAINSMTPPDIV